MVDEFDKKAERLASRFAQNFNRHDGIQETLYYGPASPIAALGHMALRLVYLPSGLLMRHYENRFSKYALGEPAKNIDRDNIIDIANEILINSER